MLCTSVELDTKHLPEFVDAWANIVRMEASPLGDTSPGLAVRAHSVSGLSIGHFQGTPARIQRTRALVGDCQDDLIFCIERRAPLRANGLHFGERVFAVGDAHVWSADTPITCEVGGVFSALMIALPGARMRAAEGVDKVLRAGGIPGSAPELRMLATYARTALDELPDMREETRRLCVSHIHDLAFAAFRVGDDRPGPQTSGVRAARLAAIKADIRAHLDEPDVTVRWITGRHRISPRYLRDLFADEDTSFTGYLTDQRLVLAHRRLGDLRLGSRTIAEIAYDCGFGDLSWFNRAFRRRFDMTPSQARGLMLERGIKQHR
jgi:AraC-like DNA-binding protein